MVPDACFIVTIWSKEAKWTSVVPFLPASLAGAGDYVGVGSPHRAGRLLIASITYPCCIFLSASAMESVIHWDGM